MRSQVRLGASANFLSIRLSRNNVVFEKKRLLLFADYFLGNILYCSLKEVRQTKF